MDRATHFVTVDRHTPLRLPPDLRDLVPPDPLAHFVVDAVEAIDVREVRVNTRGTGDAQYPPTMRLSLPGYRYATGTFGSRRIEQTAAGTSSGTTVYAALDNTWLARGENARPSRPQT